LGMAQDQNIASARTGQINLRMGVKISLTT